MVRNEIVDLTKKLISIKSESFNKKEVLKAQEYLKEYILSKTDCDVKVFEKNDVVSYYYTKKINGKEICLCGHIDVVPASLKEYIPKSDENFIYGRGAGDMKSSVAAMALIFIKNKDKNVSLLITGDEEVGSSNGAGYIKDFLDPEIVIVTEFSDNKLVLTEKAGMWVDVITKGPGGHASNPWTANNAIDILIEFVAELRKEFPILKKEEWTNTMNVGAIIGGEIQQEELGPANKLAQTAKCRLDFRLTEKTSHETIISFMNKVAKNMLHNLNENYSIEVKLFHKVDLMHTEKDHKYSKLFLDCMEENGLKRDVIKMAAASDGRFFSAKGIPVLLFGPVSIGHHSDNEKVDINSVIKTFKVIELFVSKLS